MSHEFVRKFTEGINGKAYRVELKDPVVILCRDGFRCEGELLGHCLEGIVIGCNGAIIWLNSDWIGGVVKVAPNGGRGYDTEQSVPQQPTGGKAKPSDSGDTVMKNVFSNGTRQ